MNFEAKGLYPSIEIQEPNIEYAKLLLQDYAGDTSEEMAVHLYLFQSFILNKKHPAIANNLFHIATVEMHHLKLLGKAICLLGLSPEFITYDEDNNKNYWSSSKINYNMSVKEILEIDIEKEKDAIQNYLLHCDAIKDEGIKKLLLRIIEDEIIHLEYFEKQLSVINKNMD